MTKPVCVIIGVGPGNGAAFARKFSTQGYQVALCSRNETYLNELANDISGAAIYAYDAADPNSAKTVLPCIASDLGAIDVLIYNAGAGRFGNIDNLTTEDFENAWRVNALGLFAAAQQVIPGMRAKGKGNIVVIGATSAVKHNADFSAFTSAKSAQRALAQSLAKHLGPDKVHVSYVIIDGVIDLKRTRQAMSDRPDDFFLKPHEIANAVHFLTQQDQSAWTFELDLRPFGEKW